MDQTKLVEFIKANGVVRALEMFRRALEEVADPQGAYPEDCDAYTTLTYIDEAISSLDV